MDLVDAIFADNAESLPDGKFMLFGAGIQVLRAPAFPAMIPALALVVRLRVAAQECEVEHEFAVEILDPSGSNILPNTSPARFMPHAHSPKYDLPLLYLLILKFPGLVIATPGRYAFRILVDRAEIGTAPLYIEHMSSDGETSEAKDEV